MTLVCWKIIPKRAPCSLWWVLLEWDFSWEFSNSLKRVSFMNSQILSKDFQLDFQHDWVSHTRTWGSIFCHSNFKKLQFFQWLTQSCCTEWRRGKWRRRYWSRSQATLYKPCPRCLRILKQGRTRRGGATRSRLGRRRRTRHQRVVEGRVWQRRRIERGDSRRPRLKRGGRWGVRFEFAVDRTAVVEEEGRNRRWLLGWQKGEHERPERKKLIE